MMHFNTRLMALRKRVGELTELTGSKLSALNLLIQMRQRPSGTHRLTLNGTEIAFRPDDVQALLEVLIDREYKFLSSHVQAVRSPRILDVGAHVGAFAIWALSLNPRARILSVEADATTFSITHQNVLLNRSEDWQVVNLAAAGQDNMLLRFSNNGPSMSHRIDKSGTEVTSSVSLETLLDRLCPDGSPVDILKVDIEGSEEDFLCENIPALAKVASLVVELHPGLCDTERTREVLRGSFANVEDIGGRKSTKPLLFCTR